MSDAIMEKARESAGYREKYALEHYDIIQRKKVNGHKLLIFRYSPTDPYQDANGAIFDIRTLKWVG